MIEGRFSLSWYAAIAMGLFLIAGPRSATGSQFAHVSDFVHPAHAIVEDELWIAADRILIDGRLEQSFFAVAKQAELGGVFGQDVWLAANVIGGRPQVRQSARMVARREIQFSGQTGDNFMAMSAEQVRIGPQASIGRNAVLIAPRVVIEGDIEGDVRVWAADVIVSGRIGGSLDARAAHLELVPGASIDGDVRYSSDRDPDVDSRVRIRGTLTRSRDSETREFQREWSDIGWLGQLYLYAVAVLAGLVFMALMPDYVGRSVRLVRRSFWKSLLAGAIWFVLIPIIIVLVAMTVIGLPVALLMGLAYGIMLYASKIIVGLALGGILLRRRGHQSFGPACGALLLGMLFLYLAANLPIVGAWITWMILLTGLGALLLGMRSAPAAVPPPLPATESAQPTTSVNSGD